MRYLSASDFIAGTLAISAMGILRDASENLMKMLRDLAAQRDFFQLVFASFYFMQYGMHDPPTILLLEAAWLMSLTRNCALQAQASPAWPEWPSQAQPPTLPIPTSQQPVAAPPVALKDAAPPEWLPWPKFRAALDSGSDLRTPGGMTATGRRKAVLIAMNYPGTAAERKCGGNDLDKVSGILLRLGFPDEWTLSLTDVREPSGPHTARQIDRPSKANIIASRRELVRQNFQRHIDPAIA
eukprot:Skav219282  [mRNA]  locus=scaffold2157:108207:126001:- [translate_table: standard]